MLLAALPREVYVGDVDRTVWVPRALAQPRPGDTLLGVAGRTDGYAVVVRGGLAIGWTRASAPTSGPSGIRL